jgi:hypothetical protein
MQPDYDAYYPMRPTTADLITIKCGQIRDMLLEKNLAYGDSALKPVRIFSSSAEDEQLLVRIDDKLSRIKRGKADNEDAVLDLVGYLILLLVARDMELNR